MATVQGSEGARYVDDADGVIHDLPTHVMGGFGVNDGRLVSVIALRKEPPAGRKTKRCCASYMYGSVLMT